jgi:tellurite resistance protein TerC
MIRSAVTNELLSATYRTARRVAVFVVGSTVVLVGVLMIVLPGPAFIVIPTGLAILALEFAWARRWLKIVRDRAGAAIESVRRTDADAPKKDAERLS